MNIDLTNNSLSKSEVIAKEIDKWLMSNKRDTMVVGKEYYLGKHDILNEPRTAIGDDGEVVKLDNLPDNRIVDNQYARIVDQKANYSVGNPITIRTEDKDYQKNIEEVLDLEFMLKLRTLTVEAMNCGIAWLHPYYDDSGDGKLKFKVFNSSDIMPFWKDSEHTELDFVVRVFEESVYEGRSEVTKKRIEIYTDSGIYKYDLEVDGLTGPYLKRAVDYEPYTPHMVRRITDKNTNEVEEIPHNWGKIPLIPFKYNDEELPLISRVKSIQDSLNRITSNFVNNVLEDPRNSILVVENYDGENLGKFRQNIAQYGAVKVRSGEGARGGVDILEVNINPENYKAILKQLKTSLIENARGVDSKDDRLSSGDANEMNIQSMYNDIDLDASGMETQFQSSLQELMYFIDFHLTQKGEKIDDEVVEFVFNRDILMNESEKIENFVSSYGRISDETAVTNHPWVRNIEKELEAMKEDNESLGAEFLQSMGKVNDRTEYRDEHKDERKQGEKGEVKE